MNLSEDMAGVYREPDVSRVPLSTLLRMDNVNIYPAGSDVNPGYAYGTMVPLWNLKYGIRRWYNPWTIPAVGPAMYMNWNNDVGTMNDAATLRVKGLVDEVPTYSWDGLDEIQAKAANAGV